MLIFSLPENRSHISS
jgi:Eukaryotic aspartyl protease